MPDHRYYILVKWRNRSTANSFAEDWDPDDGSGTFGSVRLTDESITTPQPEDVTHTACNTVAPQDWRDGILNAAGRVPFIDMYRIQTSYPEESMVQRRENGSWSDVREGRMEEVVLEEHGLQKIEPETL